jgi:hypothetical protein
MMTDTVDRDDLAVAASLPVATPFLVYVAGASREIARAERVIRLLAENGVAVSFDWTAHMRAVESAGPLTYDVAASSARADIDAVKRASVVVLLEPGWHEVTRGEGGRRIVSVERVPTTGAWGEATLAVGIGIPLVVARPPETQPATFAPEWQTCVFTALASLVCDDDDAAIRAVVRLALTGALPIQAVAR